VQRQHGGELIVLGGSSSPRFDQGIETFRRLTGPKRLYIGAFGHVPSTFPGPDVNVVLAEGSDWFARFLKNQPNGIDTRPPIELAPDPFLEAQNRSYPGLPPTRSARYAFAGRPATIGPLGRVVRAVGPTRGVLETFGAPVVRARVSGSFNHLVAVLENGTTLVSEGGVPLRPSAKPHTVSFRLSSDAVRLRARTLKLTLAASSTAQSAANLLYPLGVAETQRLRVGTVTVTLPVLRRPVSR
jgi:hypothetical protein